jgi:hypothetical protein
LRNFAFVVLAVLLLVALVGIPLRHYVRARKSSESTWEDLLGRLTWIDPNSIATIALDMINESGQPQQRESAFALDPSTIWTLLGGLEGLQTLEHNCQVLVELAAYVQKWYPEALVVAEQLRLNAREVEWHVNRLQGAAQTGNLQASFAQYAQRAVATYYLMTRHVLALYQQANVPGLVELQRAL